MSPIGGSLALPRRRDEAERAGVRLVGRAQHRDLDMASPHPDLDGVSVVLVLSGGSALGAYQAGGYQALHERGLRPEWVVGASTGAINGALICGNPDDTRVARLAEFWSPAAPSSVEPAWWSAPGEDMRRSLAAAGTLAVGQPRIFVPHPPGGWPASGGDSARASLFDTAPLAATLARLTDLDRPGAPRLTVTAVDLESGEPAVFDTRHARIGTDHIRASSALLPSFSPVEIDGRVYGDGGLAANLPLDPVLAATPDRATLVIALDLLPLGAPRPRSIGEATSRAQDLMFASQSRRSIAAWQTLYEARGSDAPPVTLLHIDYRRQEAEVAGKAFDFSPQTVRARWDAGYADVAGALGRLADGRLALGTHGLTVWRPPAD